MKRLLCIICIFFSCVFLAQSTVGIAFADNCININTDAIDAEENEIFSALLDRGYPESLLQSVDESFWEVLYQNDGSYFQSFSVAEYALDDKANSHESDVMPLGEIDSADLKLVCIVSVEKNRVNGKYRLALYYYYEWLSMPAMRFTDTIAMSWDDTFYSYVPDTFSRYDQYKTITGEVKTHSSGRALLAIAACGISWSADLAGYTSLPTKLFGYATWKLESSTIPPITLYSRYFHIHTGPTLVIYIPRYGPIQIPSPSRGDSRPLTTFFDPSVQ